MAGKPAAPAKPKNLGGRRTAAEEVDAYLAKNGLIATPAATAGPSPLAMEAPVAFDESGTRAGLTGLVEAASGTAAWVIGGQAERITGSEADGKKFGDAARMPEATKQLVINCGVETARKHGVNVGPEAGLVGGLGQWAMQLRGLVADLRAIAAAKPADKPAEVKP